LERHRVVESAVQVLSISALDELLQYVLELAPFDVGSLSPIFAERALRKGVVVEDRVEDGLDSLLVLRASALLHERGELRLLGLDEVERRLGAGYGKGAQNEGQNQRTDQEGRLHGRLRLCRVESEDTQAGCH